MRPTYRYFGPRGIEAKKRRRLAWLASLYMAASLAPGVVRAQPAGDADEGRRLATTWCSECHQVGSERLSRANDAVPSYQAIAAMPSTTAMSIRAFLSTSHQVMPDFNLTDAQIRDVAAYILSLRGRTPE